MTETSAYEPLASARNVLNALIGMVVVFCTLIGVGEMILGARTTGIILIAVAIGGSLLLWRRLSTTKWAEPTA